MEGGQFSVRVTGLSLNVTDDHLREIFGSWGRVRKAEVIRNKFGHSEGWGIVDYESEEQVNSAIEVMDTGCIDGLTIHVERLPATAPST